MKLTCLACGAANRVPEDKLDAGPKCGVCGERLADGRAREIDWTMLGKALRADGAPLIVDFWAPWCGPCRMMGLHFAEAARSLAPHVRAAKLNTEAFPQAGAAFGIRGIPLLIAFRGGRELGRLTGAQPARAILDWTRDVAGAAA